MARTMARTKKTVDKANNNDPQKTIKKKTPEERKKRLNDLIEKNLEVVDEMERKIERLREQLYEKRAAIEKHRLMLAQIEG